MTDSEEEGYVIYEEEDIVEEDYDDELEPIHFSTENLVDSRLSKLESSNNTCNCFVPSCSVSTSIYGQICLKISANILPLSLQNVLCLNVSPYLLNIHLILQDYDWKKRPKQFEIEHPVYQTNFVGTALVRDLAERFFSPDYQPKAAYRSKAFVLAANKNFEGAKIQKVKDHGFTDFQSRAALNQVNGDPDAAIFLLRTGLVPEGYSVFGSSEDIFVKYNDCPILYLILEIMDIYLDLTDHCCICLKPLSEPTIKPTTCDDPNCVLRYESIGIGTTVLQEIKRDPEVADLLFSVFASTISNFLNPAPKDFTEPQMTNIFKSLPPVEMLASYSSDTDICSAIGIDAYKLIRWILFTNKSHFLTLPKELRIKEINSKYQFLSLISNFEKEELFKQYKKKFGSIYLWHGSSSNRWYPILRNGLKNCSNDSKLRAHGAVHGSGIYFARNISVSKDYMYSSTNNYKRSILGPLNMVALCEVINDPKNLREVPGYCHVLTNEYQCIVRFLFIGLQTFDYDTLDRKFSKIPSLYDVFNSYADSAKMKLLEQKTIEENRKKEQSKNDYY